MALIGKIRQNMWFVFALLGVALIAFMMMDSNGPGGGGGASGQTALSVNGEKIDINRLQALEAAESSATGISGNALRSKVYEDFLTRSLVSSEGENLGIGVSEDEMEQLLYGSNLSPIIQQMPIFQDQRTGRVSMENIQNFRTNYDGKNLQKNYKLMWDEKINQVKVAEVQNKISSLVTKAIYTPTWMAEELSKTNSMSAGIDYVKVPFSAVNDSEITLSDADYNAYMDENKSQFFQKEEGRVLEYAVFAIEASKKDSMEKRQELADKIDRFKNEESDSTYAMANGGNYINFYFAKDKLPEAFQTFIGDIEVGDVYGPVVNERFYSAIKLIDKRVVADSARLSHIYRPIAATPDNSNAGQISAAVAFMDSLKVLIDSGAESFDSMAIKNSQDPSSASKGGDLGYIQQGDYFPVINEKAFFSGKIGELYTVTSPNGVHLIKVTDRIFMNEDPKYKVAFINNGIEPTDETIEEITNKASEFISDNRDLESMRKAISKYPRATLKTSKVLSKQDYMFEEYNFDDDARNIILWAFNDETSVGDVAPDMYSFRDKQFNYEKAIVVPALQAKTPKGMSSLKDVKASITDQVRDYAKSKALVSNLKGKSMADATSMAGATTGTIDAVRTSSSFVGELGYEPKVMAAIIATPEGATTQPIIGTSGVYLVKLNSKSAPSTGNNAFAKQSENMRARQNVNFNLFEAMRKGAKVKDKRMDFSM